MLFGSDSAVHASAVFTGKNGSLGFRAGQTYDIEIFIHSRHIWIKHGSTECPYQTMRALLKNWKFDA